MASRDQGSGLATCQRRCNGLTMALSRTYTFAVAKTSLIHSMPHSFPQTFPTLFPFGVKGGVLVDEGNVEVVSGIGPIRGAEAVQELYRQKHEPSDMDS